MTLSLLRERQAWPLEQKIDHTGNFDKDWRRFQGEWANHKIVPCNCKKYFEK
ncbi:hypothetical protein [Alistipes sp.]|uniref:hypothetical protein n=1 Tax=Alistipes sp. TaxID=1872444 RepID=UPI003526FA87